MERLEKPGFVVEPVDGFPILKLIRNSAPFEHQTELVSLLHEIEEQFKRVDREQYGLLVDTRAVAGRTDPRFERTFRRWRTPVLQGFKRVAILVATPEGKAQAEKHAAEHGAHVSVFDDENAAFEWLKTELA